MKKKKSTQTKKEEQEKLRKSPKKPSGESYTLTPAQIAKVYFIRKIGGTWAEAAESVGYSVKHFHRIREYMKLDDEIESIKSVMRECINIAAFSRATGMPKIKTSRKVQWKPTGEIDKNGKPLYSKEVTVDKTESYLAPDVAAMEFFLRINEVPEIEVIPNFVSEYPVRKDDDATEEN